MKDSDKEEKINVIQENLIQAQLETEIIKSTIAARKKSKLTQRELSKKTGIKQSAIARIEKHANSPQTKTLIKLLYPMGYTIKVIALDKLEK